MVTPLASETNEPASENFAWSIGNHYLFDQYLFDNLIRVINVQRSDHAAMTARGLIKYSPFIQTPGCKHM